MINIYNRIMRGNKRSVLVKKNIIGSFIMKGLAVII